jgi:hypothetical protein
MNEADTSARRYHWFSENIQDLVCEPHTGIVTPTKQQRLLNLTARDSENTRQLSVEFVSSGYRPLMKDIEILRKHSSELSSMVGLKHKEQ